MPQLEKQPRVLLVDFTTSFGGAFEYAVTMAEWLQRTGRFTVGLVTAQPEETLRERATDGVTFFPIQGYRKVYSPVRLQGAVGKGLNAAADLLAGELPRAIKLLRIYRSFHPDIVHLNNLINIQQSGVLASRLARAKCVFCHHDFEYRSNLALLASRFVDHHVAISGAMKEHLHDFGIEERKISVIHHGIDTRRFSPSVIPADLAGRYGIGRDKLVFAIFGRLVEWKGQRNFLRVAKLVLERVPNAHGLIVGDTSDGDPEFGEELRRLAIELGISERVTFAGYARDTENLMAASAIVLHLSTRPEPFGLVIAEAMACARPVIAAAEGGPLDIVEDGITGVLVPPNDVAASAEAVSTVLLDRERASAMGEAGRSRVERMFSLERCINDYIAMYEQVLAGELAK